MFVDLALVKSNQEFVGATALQGVFANQFLDVDLTGSNLTEIGVGFQNSNITSINLSNTPIVTANAFLGCVQLSRAELPNEVILKERCFAGSGLESVELDRASIGELAFGSCLSLQSATIVSPVEFGEAIFNKCTKLDTVHLIGCKIDISKKMFKHTALKSLGFVPSGVSIGQFGFYGCPFKHIDLSPFDSIGDGAFAHNPVKVESLVWNNQAKFGTQILRGTEIDTIRATINDVDILSGANIGTMTYICGDDDSFARHPFTSCNINLLKISGDIFTQGIFHATNIITRVDANDLKELAAYAFHECIVHEFVTDNQINMGSGCLKGVSLRMIKAPRLTLTSTDQIASNRRTLLRLEVFEIVSTPDKPFDLNGYENLDTIKLHDGNDVPFNIAQLCRHLQFGDAVKHVRVDFPTGRRIFPEGEVSTRPEIFYDKLISISGPNVRSIIPKRSHEFAGAFAECSNLRAVDCPQLRALGQECFMECESLDCAPFVERLKIFGDDCLHGTYCSQPNIHIRPNVLGVECLSKIKFGRLEVDWPAQKGRYKAKRAYHPFVDRSTRTNTGLSGVIADTIVMNGDTEIFDILLGGVCDARVLDLTRLGKLKELADYALDYTNIEILLLPPQPLIIGEFALSSSKIRVFDRPNDTLKKNALLWCKQLTVLNATINFDVIGSDNDSGINTCSSVKMLTLHGPNIPSCLCSNWRSLHHVELGPTVETIGERSFSDTPSLRTFDAGRIKNIGPAAFQSSGLYEFAFPSTIQTIYHLAFERCKSIERVHVAQTDSPVVFKWEDRATWEDELTTYGKTIARRSPVFPDSPLLKYVFLPPNMKYIDEEGNDITETVFDSRTRRAQVSRTKKILVPFGDLVQEFTQSAFENGNLSVFDIEGVYSLRMQRARKHVVDMVRVWLGTLPIELEDMIFKFLGVGEINRISKLELAPLRPGVAKLTEALRIEKAAPGKNLISSVDPVARSNLSTEEKKIKRTKPTSCWS